MIKSTDQKRETHGELSKEQTTMKKIQRPAWLILVLVLIVGAVGCRAQTESTGTAVSQSAPTVTAETTDNQPPQTAEYNLGEATIIQERFPEDSNFRNMPVRLNGVIAAPASDGPYPVVVILHGTHPGCPVNDTGHVDPWPCDPEVERANYRGFAYLAEALAAHGYVALSININAENTFGFGEPVAGERLEQIVRLHLDALAAAATGGPNDFGVALDGRADVARLAFIGHSRGAEMAAWLAENGRLASADGAVAYPIAAVLQVAPAISLFQPVTATIPMGLVQAACDGDVTDLIGQTFYENNRLDPAHAAWTTAVYLAQANHNQFNTLLGNDPFGTRNRPDCETLLPPDVQRDFLARYALDFMTAVFSDDPATQAAAFTRLGMDVTAPAPAALYGQPALVAARAPAANRQTLFVPRSEAELTTNLLRGTVTAVNAAATFCPEGYYTPDMLPGSEPCMRVNLTMPGQPATAVVSWSAPDAALRFAVPEEAGDLSAYTAVSLRAALNPLSSLNTADSPQQFSVQLTDQAGQTALVRVPPTEPALQFPAGIAEEDSFFAGGLFSGIVPLITLRLPLSSFTGVDLSQIREVALVFDQTSSGSLFIADLEWVQAATANQP